MTSHEFINHFAIDQLFDYNEFYEKNIMPDCIVILPNGKKIPAHRIILGQFSTFLYNAFTSGMQEESKREVSINFDPGDQFINILGYMYNGEIQITDENVLQLIETTHFYGIYILYNFIVNDYLSQVLTPSNIFSYVDKCFDMELNESLLALAPYLARFYHEINISTFSEKLDISTFCHVLALAIQNGTFKDDVVAELNAFMNGAVPNENQKQALNSLLQEYGGNSTHKPCW